MATPASNTGMAAQIDIVRRPWEIEHLFLDLFRDYWTVLPRPEAAEVVDEMTQRIMAKRDEGTFGKVQDLEFNSLHSLKLFQIYDLLQELRPERAQQLVKKKRELAKAVKRYPNGLKTIREEVYASLPPQESLSNRRTPASVVSSATGDDHNYALALLAGRTTQDFDQPLQSARASYMNDNGPNFRNFAPKAFWPSTAMYKTVFYHMGFVGKGGADQLLDQVPDKELRLLAQIELAAGLSKLPELVVKTQRTPG